MNFFNTTFNNFCINIKCFFIISFALLLAFSKSFSQSQDEYWLTETDLKGANGFISEIAIDGSDIYFAGQFTYFGGEELIGIIKWDGEKFEAIEGYAGQTVYTMVAQDGMVYITTNDIHKIQRWDGEQWEFIGENMDSQASVLIPTENGLYAGGGFTTINNEELNGIAFWDGNEWHGLGEGISGDLVDVIAGVSDILLKESNVYIVGSFSKAGDVLANGVASWDGQKWTALGDGFNGYATVISEFNNNILVGGDFTEADSAEAKRIAKWDGEKWSPMGEGFESLVFELEVYNGEMLVGNSFNKGERDSEFKISSWNGSEWTAFADGLGRSITSLKVKNGQLYVGGIFHEISNLSTNNVAYYDGATWKTFSGQFNNGPNGKINEVFVDGSDVYIGGQFTKIGDLLVNHIAKWDGEKWNALGSGLNDEVHSIKKLGDTLVIGGDFTKADGNRTSFVAMWYEDSWKNMGYGVNGSVRELNVYNDELYIVGGFSYSGEEELNGIAKWNGNEWESLGTGFATDFNYFAGNTITNYDNSLVAGGYFSYADGVLVNNMAQWNGNQWSAFPGDIDYISKIHSSGDSLYAYGTINDTTGLAIWYGSSWKHIKDIKFNNGGVINDIYSDGENIYIAGKFKLSNSNSFSYLSKWDGHSWSTFGSGVDKNVKAISSDGRNIYVGGEFLNAGIKTSLYYAVFDEDPDQDGIKGSNDNCPETPNPDQIDLDNDDFGEACDCDDNDENINPLTSWYIDNDKDGYGDASVSLKQCEQPDGYVLNSDDCQDDNNEINPSTTWYTDNDNDGYGDESTSLTQCEQLDGYVLDNTDCDDDNLNINPDTKWYADIDNDGFGDESNSTTQCIQPENYVLDNSDCDDNNSEIHPGADVKQNGKDNNCDGIIEVITDLKENTQNSVTAYPNPSSSLINFKLKCQGQKGNASISIYNLTGEKIFTRTFVQSGKSLITAINISNLNNGMYIYKINSQDLFYIGTFIKSSK